MCRNDRKCRFIAIFTKINSAQKRLIIITWPCGFWCVMASIFPWQWAKLIYICPASSNLVCNEGQRVSSYYRRQWPVIHWHCLWKIPPIIAVKSSVTTFIQFLRFVVNMSYCGRVAFTVFKHADNKGVRQRLTSTARGDNSRRAWNGSCFDHICTFYVEMTNIHGG